MKRNHESNGGIMVAVTGSMTAALRAQRALTSAAIRADIVKSDNDRGRGCGFGVAFAATQQSNVRAILANAHVNVRRYTQEHWPTV